MSWLARSLANSLRLDEDHRDGDGGDESDVVPDHPNDAPTTSPRSHELHYLLHQRYDQQQQHQDNNNTVESDEESQDRGVKEDLDEIKKTITRQFWGMASFLAPPPSNSHPSSPEHHRFRSGPDAFIWDRSGPSDQCVCGNEQQRAEALDDAAIIRDVSDVEKGRRLALDDPDVSGSDRDLIPFGSDSVFNQEREMEDCDIEVAVGITEEVFAFATNIAMNPETWLDFPIDEDEDTDDFRMSHSQRDHALAIERLVPRLAALRIELCPCHMSESYFWKVYFVLLHSRLDKQDAEILSTPQVMAARGIWMQESQKQLKPEFELFNRSFTYSREMAQHDSFAPSLLDDAYSEDMPHGHGTDGYEMATLSIMADYETEKHAVESSENHVIEEKPVTKTEDIGLKSGQTSQFILQNYEDDEDEWPEEDSEFGEYDRTIIPVGKEEDISFSDLEDDDYDIKPVKSCTS